MNPLIQAAIIMALAAVIAPAVYQLLDKGEKKLEDLEEGEPFLTAHPAAKTILEKVTHLLFVGVKAAFQVFVDDAKAEGSFDKTLAEKIKVDLLAWVKGMLTADGIKQLMGELGLSTGAQLDDYLAKLLEAAVHDVKLQKAVAAPQVAAVVKVGPPTVNPGPGGTPALVAAVASTAKADPEATPVPR